MICTCLDKYNLDMFLFTFTVHCLPVCLEHISTVFLVHVCLSIHATWHSFYVLVWVTFLTTSGPVCPGFKTWSIEEVQLIIRVRSRSVVIQQQILLILFLRLAPKIPIATHKHLPVPYYSICKFIFCTISSCASFCILM